MKRTLSAAVALAFALTLLFVQAALAHERRTVGKYEFVVGFITEPAYVGLPNAVDLRVTDTETKKPVEGLEKTLKVTVIVGGKSKTLDFRTRFNQPGAYAADFVPTKHAAYIFQIAGEIEGKKIDEKFESGPGRFHEPEDTHELEFPEKLANPTTLAAQLKAAQDAASSAQTVAYAALALGLAGSALGLFALRRK